MGLMKKMFQMDEKLSFAVEFFLHFKFNGQKVKEIEAFQSRIGYRGDYRRNINHFNQMMYQSCFTGTHIARKQQKAFVLQNSVFECG